MEALLSPEAGFFKRNSNGYYIIPPFSACKEAICYNYVGQIVGKAIYEGIPI